MGSRKGKVKRGKGKDRWTRDGKDIAKLESRIAKVEDGRANDDPPHPTLSGKSTTRLRRFFLFVRGSLCGLWKKRQEPIADQPLAVGDGPRGQARFEGVLNPTAVHERERG
jgi:hypothetical protein